MQLYCAVCKLGVLHKVVGLPTIVVMVSIPDIWTWTSTQSFILGLFSYRYQCQKYLQYSLKCWNRIVSLSTESMSSWTKPCCILNVSSYHPSCRKIEMKHYYFTSPVLNERSLLLFPKTEHFRSCPGEVSLSPMEESAPLFFLFTLVAIATKLSPQPPKYLCNSGRLNIGRSNLTIL